MHTTSFFLHTIHFCFTKFSMGGATFKKHSADPFTSHDHHKKKIHNEVKVVWVMPTLISWATISITKIQKKRMTISILLSVLWTFSSSTNVYNYMQLIVKWKVCANIAQSYGSFHQQWKHLYVQHLVTQSRGNYGR